MQTDVDESVRYFVSSLTNDDLPFEEDVSANATNEDAWLRYLEHNQKKQQRLLYSSDAPPVSSGEQPWTRFYLFERALRAVPGSVQLWTSYLSERTDHCRGHYPLQAPHIHPAFEAANQLFERALAACLRDSPDAWLSYCEFLAHQGLISRVRHCFNRGLRCLQPADHGRLWRRFLRWALDVHGQRLPQLAVHVYRRLLPVRPLIFDEYLAFLRRSGLHADALAELAALLIRRADRVADHSRHDASALWMQLCDIIATHLTTPHFLITCSTNPPTNSNTPPTNSSTPPTNSSTPPTNSSTPTTNSSTPTTNSNTPTANSSSEIVQFAGFTVDQLLQHGHDVFRAAGKDVSHFELALAGYRCRHGRLLEAQQGLRAALKKADQLADFARLWEAAAQLQDAWVSRMIESLARAGPELRQRLEAQLKRQVHVYKKLLAMRPILVQDLVLRQRPHDVDAWMKKARLLVELRGDVDAAAAVYTRAIETVRPERAQPRHSSWQLWAGFARLYERHGQVDSARAVFEQAVNANYSGAAELAMVWCCYAEMLLRLGRHRAALDTLRTAVALPMAAVRAAGAQARRQLELSGSALAAQVYKSTRLWSLLLDVEETFGTPASLAASYAAAVQLRVLTPEMVLNYAGCLLQRQRVDDAFRVYEQAVALFPQPYAAEIWLSYLTARVELCGGRDADATRDLFEQALDALPAGASPLALGLLLVYAHFEETHGQPRTAMFIYRRGVPLVPERQRVLLCRVHLARAAHFFGLHTVRQTFDLAVESVAPVDVPPLCLQYADLEERLGELRRARAIYAHCAQYCPPKSSAAFWSRWQQFEADHPDPAAAADMLRIKNRVALSYSKAYVAGAVGTGSAILSSRVHSFHDEPGHYQSSTNPSNNQSSTNPSINQSTLVSQSNNQSTLDSQSTTTIW